MATKITYTQQGVYLLPDLKLPEQPKVEIGIWGAGVQWTPLPRAEAPTEPTGETKRHLRYIKQYRPILYTNLLTKCKLTNYLADIDKEANEMFDRIVKQLAKQEGITEQLKADNQMQWVRKMNNIHNQVTEIVNNEIIYK